MADTQGEPSPAKGDTREVVAPKNVMSGVKARPAKSSLQAKLQDRERQLRELTEQCLHFLDLLHAARQKAPEVARLERKVSKLEEVLTDARRRVKNSRSVLIPGRKPSDTRQLEVVVWPSSAGAVDLAKAVTLARRFPKTPITCICPVDGGPAAPEVEVPANLQILAADCRTAAQYWNTSMAATESAGVLFLAAGTDLEDGALEALEKVQDDVFALGQPTLVHGDGKTTLGLEDLEIFQFRRSPAAAGRSRLLDLEYIPPEAFFLRRDAFHSLGPFDEDLLGHLALVDYCLRARSQNFRLVGARDARVGVPDPMDLVIKDNGTERDRLVLLARHRPGEVADALTGMDLFWSLPLSEREGFLRALFLRLPGANMHSEALAMLVKEALILVRKTVPRPLVERSLRGLQEAVESSFELGLESDSPALGESEEEDPVGAVRHRLDRLRITFDKLRVQVETERNAHKNLLEQLISQIKGERLANQQLFGQLKTDRTSNEALRDELNAALAHKDELEISLRAELNNTRAQKQQLEKDLEAELERHRVQKRELEAKFRAELDKINAQRDALENSLLAERSLVARLTGDVEKLTGDAKQLAEKVGRLTGEATRLNTEAEARRRDAEQRQAQLEAERQRGAESRRIFDDGMRLIAEAVTRNDLREPTALAARIKEVRSDLAKRNHWVTLLLQEIARWRLKPYPRQLSTAEKKFLETHGGDGAG